MEISLWTVETSNTCWDKLRLPFSALIDTQHQRKSHCGLCWELQYLQRQIAKRCAHIMICSGIFQAQAEPKAQDRVHNGAVHNVRLQKYFETNSREVRTTTMCVCANDACTAKCSDLKALIHKVNSVGTPEHITEWFCAPELLFVRRISPPCILCKTVSGAALQTCLHQHFFYCYSKNFFRKNAWNANSAEQICAVTMLVPVTFIHSFNTHNQRSACTIKDPSALQGTKCDSASVWWSVLRLFHAILEF